ncbi:MAG: hypothetical protein J7L55_00410 [Desulfurococcales archaeon]|nr:hypothetical protein [Desulfurococcales archaeon]
MGKLRNTGAVDVSTLTTLYEIRRVGRNSIARELATKLNLTPRTALRKLQSLIRLRKHNLFLTVDYSLPVIGLKGVMLLSHDSSKLDRFSSATHFLRSTFLLLPFGRGIALYVPYGSEFYLSSASDLFIFEYVDRFRNRVDVVRYGLRAITDPEVATSEKSFQKLKEDIDQEIKKLEALHSSELAQVPGPMKYDWIDLTIIKELEKDPLQRLDDISRAVNLPISKIVKHSTKHVLHMLRGVRVRYIPVYTFFDSNAVIRVASRDPASIWAFGKALVKNPLFPTYGLGKGLKTALVQLIAPFSLLRKALEHIMKIAKEFSIDVDTNSVWLFSTSGRRFTIPYIKWEEYIPRVKWNVELLNKVISKELREE